MAFELPPLPFAKDALASRGMSEETLDYHYGKHHQTYVNNLNGLVEGTENADNSLEQIIKEAETHSGLFNNAAQVWNHTFFWSCLSPTGGGEPSGDVAEQINSAFGSVQAFRDEFTNAAKTQFGSGWAWLAHDGGGLKVMKTLNADTPVNHEAKALLTLDVWEHAYYLDFRNSRPGFIDNFFDQLVNWDFVAQNLSEV
ncbi:MAG: superoxide dismutase [Acidimicrobiales bacterium]|nr:superoxide dismutase [Acidimicrobiales bacterium]